MGQPLLLSCLVISMVDRCNSLLQNTSKLETGGLEIMSPSYLAVRDGQETIPKMETIEKKVSVRGKWINLVIFA
jgi:hypothetical protein